MTPEAGKPETLGTSIFSVAPPVDGASNDLAKSLVAGPAIVGSNKILVHRKAILSVMAQNRALQARNEALQKGIDEAAVDNNGLAAYLEAALDMLREAKGWDHKQTGEAISALIRLRTDSQTESNEGA